MKKEFIERAEKLIGTSSHCALTSIDKNGYPRTVTMPFMKVDGIKKAWFVTWDSSDKAKNFRKNPKAGMCCSNMVSGDNITLTGEMKIVSDSAFKKTFWNDMLFDYFPGGSDDPNFCVLEFTSNVARMRIDYGIEEVAY